VKDHVVANLGYLGDPLGTYNCRSVR
jgi:hypothetical protein